MNNTDMIVLQEVYLSINEGLSNQEDTEQLYTIFISQALDKIKQHSSKPIDTTVLESVLNRLLGEVKL